MGSFITIYLFYFKKKNVGISPKFFSIFQQYFKFFESVLIPNKSLTSPTKIKRSGCNYRSFRGSKEISSASSTDAFVLFPGMFHCSGKFFKKLSSNSGVADLWGIHRFKIKFKFAFLHNFFKGILRVS
ncbi:MAG: hypothetical protein Ct9H300mP23_08360 [Nitrospinota bacterium]|nr:MAG: hypothetical protein Ct9H300mP23_08360 [Nitrospinota bacterium]